MILGKEKMGRVISFPKNHIEKMPSQLLMVKVRSSYCEKSHQFWEQPIRGDISASKSHWNYLVLELKFLPCKEMFLRLNIEIYFEVLRILCESCSINWHDNINSKKKENKIINKSDRYQKIRNYVFLRFREPNLGPPIKLSSKTIQ